MTLTAARRELGHLTLEVHRVTGQNLTTEAGVLHATEER
jgi:hypothetical protein